MYQTESLIWLVNARLIWSTITFSNLQRIFLISREARRSYSRRDVIVFTTTRGLAYSGTSYPVALVLGVVLLVCGPGDGELSLGLPLEGVLPGDISWTGSSSKSLSSSESSSLPLGDSILGLLEIVPLFGWSLPLNGTDAYLIIDQIYK